MPARTRRRAFAGAAVLLAALAQAAGGARAEAPARHFLRIAAWDLAVPVARQAAAERPPDPSPATPTTAYRHTFGSERRTTTYVSALPARVPDALDADVIAIQGLADPRKARQVFPAGDYHLIVSRQVLFKSPDAEAASRRGVTAVAVRRRPDVKVIGQDHLLAPAVPLTEPNAALAIWATGVRLLVGGEAIWVVAVDLTHDCAPGGPVGSASETGRAPCSGAPSQARRLSAWLASRRAEGDTAVAAGTYGESTVAAKAAISALTHPAAPSAGASAGAAPAAASTSAASSQAALAVYSQAGAATCAGADPAKAGTHIVLDPATPRAFKAPAAAHVIGADGKGTPPGRCTLAIDLELPTR